MSGAVILWDLEYNLGFLCLSLHTQGESHASKSDLAYGLSAWYAF